MSEENVSLRCSDKTLAKHENFNKEELERLLRAVLSRASRPDQTRRIELVGHTDSANKVKSTRIKAKYDAANTRVEIKIQVIGFHEIWLIGVYLLKEDQRVYKTFEKEIQVACEAVVEEEKKRQQGTPADVPLPADNPDDTDATGKKPGKAVPEMATQSQRRKGLHEDARLRRSMMR